MRDGDGVGVAQQVVVGRAGSLGLQNTAACLFYGVMFDG